jgi:hypothetical protein
MTTQTSNIQNDIQNTINNFTKDEINELINLHKRYEIGIVALNITTHVLSGTTTICAFVGAICHPFIIASGVISVFTSASIAFNNYLLKALKANDNELQKYLNQFGIKDTIEEPDNDNDSTPATPTNNNNTPSIAPITPTPNTTPTQIIVQP